MSQKMLPHYQDILCSISLPVFCRTKNISVEYDETNSLSELWKIHDQSIHNKENNNKKCETSLLDLKILIAKKLFSDCVFCEHQCRIDRNKESGVCEVKNDSIATEFIHHGEEKIIVPSHTIFFSGCNFSCCFCQNFDISQKQVGLCINPEYLALRIQSAHQNGSKNINWVGGEPTPHVLYILNVLKHVQSNIPQIWNSNMYCSKETMQLLNGIIDVYLTDFKFGNNECAKKLAGINRYTETIKRNHILAKEQTDLLVRHLVLPNHIDCCSKPLIKWIAKYLPKTPVNIMDQYHPTYKSRLFPSVNTIPSVYDMERVLSYADELGISRV
jgi:putative pyruvate formate lyase activating enzyme